MKHIFVLLLLVLFGYNVRAQDDPGRFVYIIFDASGSMWGKLSDDSYKIHTARTVLTEFLSQDLENTQVAFRAYGHRREGDCSDTQLVIPFTSTDELTKPLGSFLQDVNPKGKTPIHGSLTAALNDFGERTGDIVLITDGIETCNADPCALMKSWKERDIDINVHVVGLGLEQKEKDALACISKEAGTPFYEAHSAEELGSQLTAIKEVSKAGIAFILKGIDENGEHIAVNGTLTAEDGSTYEVTSNRRNQVPSGTYELQVGVLTRNDNLYQPIYKSISVASEGETVETVEVTRPPVVRISFREDGEPAEMSSTISVYQGNVEKFRFRSIDAVFIDEGNYTFKTSPNGDNDLSVAVEIGRAEQKEVVFDLKRTVRIYAKMFAAGSNTRFRKHLELFQEGEKKYRVHSGNGAQVLPGTYILRLEDELQHYEQEIVITGEDNQEFNVTVPVGHAIVRYQTADGKPDKSARCFTSKAGSNTTVFWNSDQAYPLRPGVYTVRGWRNKGDYEPVTFEVKEGEEIEVVLKAKI